MKLFPIYQDLASPITQNGKTMDFWIGAWNGRPKVEILPHLHSFAIKPHISVFEIHEQKI